MSGGTKRYYANQQEARWQHHKASAPQPTIGTLVEDAMSAIRKRFSTHWSVW